MFDEKIQCDLIDWSLLSAPQQQPALRNRGIGDSYAAVQEKATSAMSEVSRGELVDRSVSMNSHFKDKPQMRD